MTFDGFSPAASEFLWELSFNNERPWFQAHKDQYEAAVHEPFQALAEEVSARMSRDYPLAEFRLHVSRIYRDARRLYGRGPFKDHLWFTLFHAANRYTEGPMFWFEISPAEFSYGLGYFDISPAEMDAFRRRVDANPAQFETLAASAMKMRGFHVIGPEYKRQKKDLGSVINPWYNRKRFGLEYAHNFDAALLGPDLPDRLCRCFRRLMPLYEYFYACYAAAQEQSPDELRRIDHADQQ